MKPHGKISAALAALLLAGCASTQMDHPLKPSEQIWRDAYCGYEPMPDGDYERITRWAEDNYIRCRGKGKPYAAF